MKYPPPEVLLALKGFSQSQDMLRQHASVVDGWIRQQEHQWGAKERLKKLQPAAPFLCLKDFYLAIVEQPNLIDAEKQFIAFLEHTFGPGAYDVLEGYRNAKNLAQVWTPLATAFLAWRDK